MILCIADVLRFPEWTQAQFLLGSAQFESGERTAGWHARLVKRNLQLVPDAPAIVELRTLVQQALHRNPLFQMAALPKALHPILFSRYESGMSYGNHVDNAFMGEELLRSDISFTLFLSEPHTYSGGELVIEGTHGEQSFKLAAGSLILYPASTLHRVEPVTAGVRFAAVSWVQSLVRDASDREILFDLETVRQALFTQSGKTPEFDLLSKSYANLLRKWGN
jgi:PKHD-type hydroxylase